MAASPTIGRLLGVCALLAASSYAHAQGIALGKSLWQGQLTGESQSQTDRTRKLKPVNFTELSLTHEEYPSYWVALEHPIPWVPHVRVDYTQVESSKRVRKSISLSPEQNIDTTLAFNSLEATFYYEVLDNWINLDAGLSLRKLDGYLDVYYELGYQFPINFPHSYTELNEIVPMLYSQAQLNIPNTGLFLQARLNGISTGGDRFMDAEANLGYQWHHIPGLDIGVLLGYRNMQLALKNTGKLYADAQIDGIQGSFFVHF